MDNFSHILKKVLVTATTVNTTCGFQCVSLMVKQLCSLIGTKDFVYSLIEATNKSASDESISQKVIW